MPAPSAARYPIVRSRPAPCSFAPPRLARHQPGLTAPGAYVWLTHQHTLGVQIAVTGERKANDDMAGMRTDDTGITSVYVGPRLAYTYQMRLSALISKSR